MKFSKKYWLVGSLAGIFLSLSVSGFVFAVNPPSGSGGSGYGVMVVDADGTLRVTNKTNQNDNFLVVSQANRNVGVRKVPDDAQYELDVNGDIRGTTLTGIFLGTIPAENVLPGVLGGTAIGNFGIGVTTPGAKFDVDVGSGVAGQFKSSAIGDTFVIRDGSGIVARFANNSGWNVIGKKFVVRDAANSADRAVISDITFALRNAADTADVAAVRRDTGDVGSGYFSSYVKIGTTAIATPAAGMIRWTGPSGSPANEFQGYDGTTWKTFGGSGSGWTKLGTNVILSTITDKVGIGTNSPENSLTVNGGFNVTGAVVPVTTGLALSDEGLYKSIQSYDTEPLAINPLGNNVGIGAVTNPASTLHVQGSARVTDNFYVLGGQAVAPGSSNLEVYGNAAAPVVRIRNTGARVMQAAENLVDLANINATDEGTILKITNANPNFANAAVMIGKVGISTSTTFTIPVGSTSTLYVNGTIYADRVLNAVYAP